MPGVGLSRGLNPPPLVEDAKRVYRPRGNKFLKYAGPASVPKLVTPDAASESGIGPDTGSRSVLKG